MKNSQSQSAISHQIASELLKIKAIKLSPEQPFTWASGWKSPIYCDNRMTLAYPELRSLIKNSFAETIKANYPDVDMIAGVATAGVPQGALVADALDLPFIYVRDKAKSHGMTNRIEGEIREGKKVFVIEDLISTGGSAIKAIDAIIEVGMEVLGLGAIFTYGFPQAADNLEAANIEHFTLSDYNTMVDIAIEENYIQEDEKSSLNAWRMAPDDWKK